MKTVKTVNADIARTFGRYVALPVISAGIIGGAALGMAGVANAAPATSQNGTNNSHFFAPDTKAQPAPNVQPRWHHSAARVERLEPGYHHHR